MVKNAGSKNKHGRLMKNMKSPNSGLNDELSCRREEGNISDSYTVAFIKSVSHVPHWIFNKDIAILIEEKLTDFNFTVV